MPHCLVPIHILINELHHLTRIEPIILTEVNKESLKALFCLTCATAACCSALTTPATTLLTIAASRWFLNLWRILIIVEEASKGGRNNLLDKILLIYILKLAVDILHVRCYLLLIHIRLQDVIHRFEELFLAYLFRRRKRSINKLLTYLTFNVTYLIFLTRVDNRNGSTLLARTTCTTRTMGIVFYIIR